GVQQQPQQQMQHDSIFDRFKQAFIHGQIFPKKEDIRVNSQVNLPDPGQPAFWCHVFYYEFNERIGEPFKGDRNEVIVDGFCAPSESSRFCLGALGNVNRNPVVVNARRQIGRGCRIYSQNDGNIYVDCVSDSPIFVQSPIYAASARDHLATVYRLPHGNPEI
uniref:MH2 domain-containing protein n=1 Tax=Acrobeloides nanus TaxID=290746 RepID=A0A914DEI6_9BILA